MGTSGRLVAATLAVALLSACTAGTDVVGGTPSSTDTPVAVGSIEPSASPSSGATPSPTDTPLESAPETTPGESAVEPSSKPDDVEPLPKVQRSDAAEPTITATPADIEEEVAYPDGVTLRIVDVEFGEETKEGPGRFPGREFAIFDVEVDNGGERALDMNTTVISVLDSDGEQAAPVYVEDADVADFAGTVQPGKSAKARYAFAVPKNSRSEVTVVVDFDGVHTSAVFRGELS